MYQETYMEYAGNLCRETKEVESIMPENRKAEQTITVTQQCGQLLTLICC